MKNTQSPATDQTTSPRSALFHRIAAAGAAIAFAATLLPMAMAGPAAASGTKAVVSVTKAAASVTKYGCTVTPAKPKLAGFTGSGRLRISYAVDYSCNGKRSIEIEQRRYESDTWPNGDDFTGKSTIVHRFAQPSTQSQSVKDPMIFKLPDTELGREEVYHKVRFRVTAGDITSAWTPWVSSRETSFAN